MNRFMPVLAVIGFAFADIHADLKSDILNFTGASRAKFVWYRDAYCSEAYEPIASKKSVMIFDTEEGTERTLATASPGYIRVSRSGRWATWNESRKTYIISLTDPSATKKVLLDEADCTYWCGRAFWVDQETGQEYIFALDRYQQTPFNNTLVHGQDIYKIPLTNDGSADKANAEKLTINWAGEHWVDDVISISADGKKLGGAFPWPETYILDIPSGDLDYRHETGFGCQANLAPDNSYRFFHCEGDHFGIYMWDKDMINEHWYINLSKNLAGFEGKDGMDFAAPRWSNHVQFVSNNFPMDDNWEVWDISCDQSDDMLHIRQCVLQKLSSDFRSIESSLLIASDRRYQQSQLDSWLSNGVVAPGSVSAAPRPAADMHARRIFDENSVSLAKALRTMPNSRLCDVRGRTVAKSQNAVSDGSLQAGLYIFSAHADGKSRAQHFAVAE